MMTPTQTLTADLNRLYTEALRAKGPKARREFERQFWTTAIYLRRAQDTTI